VYPGYEPDEVTPLPKPFLARDILSTAIGAQQDLRKKVRNVCIMIEFLSLVQFNLFIILCTFSYLF